MHLPTPEESKYCIRLISDLPIPHYVVGPLSPSHACHPPPVPTYASSKVCHTDDSSNEPA